jgi:membrane protease YdiL (CAAX protease family)
VKAGAVHAGSLERYLEVTRRLPVAVCFIVPLVLLHAAAVARSDRFVQVGAERFVQHVLRTGPTGERILQVVLALIVTGSIAYVIRAKIPVHRYFVPFVVECLLLALVLGPLVSIATNTSLFGVRAPPEGAAVWPFVLGAIGAGIYEEIVFRLLLLGSVALLFRRGLGFSAKGSAALAIFVSAVFFAQAHFFGTGAEAFAWRPYAFRLAAGLLLGLAFVLRGLGVAVYLHAFYDALFAWRVAVASE